MNDTEHIQSEGYSGYEYDEYYDEDEDENASDECGQTMQPVVGQCAFEGTEYCGFICPFRHSLDSRQLPER